MEISITTITARMRTPPRTPPKMIHFVLHRDELTTNTTDRVLRVDDSVLVFVRLQDLGVFTTNGISANEVGHPPFCSTNTKGVFEGFSGVFGRTISISPILAHPLTTTVVPVPTNVNVPGTSSEPLIVTIPSSDGSVTVGEEMEWFETNRPSSHVNPSTKPMQAGTGSICIGIGMKVSG